MLRLEYGSGARRVLVNIRFPGRELLENQKQMNTYDKRLSRVSFRGICSDQPKDKIETDLRNKDDIYSFNLYHSRIVKTLPFILGE